MALKDILDKIAGDAESESLQIRKEAEGRVSKIQEEAKAQADRLAAELRRRSQERADSERLRIINNAQLENRKRVLTEQRRAIEAVFDEVKKKLRTLDDKDFQKLAISLLKRATLDGDEELIVPAKDKARYTPQLIAAMNASLGNKGKLRLSGTTGDFEGGFVLKKGARKDDLSLNRVFTTLREQLEPEIVSILFGGSTK